MSTLVLVDLDSLLGAWEDTGPPADGDPRLPMVSAGGCWLQADEGQPAVGAPAACVVVLGMNTATVLRPVGRDVPSMTWEWAQRFGHALALSLCGGTASRVEVALTLTGPEAVDSVLYRLLLASPWPGTIDVARVVLLSGDRDLKDRIEREVRPGLRRVPAGSDVPSGRMWVRAKGAKDDPWRAAHACRVWTARRGAGRRRRGIPRAPVVPAPGPLPEGWSVPIDGASLVVAAAGRSVDFAGTPSLAALAKAIGRDRPHLLSQIGPTTSSLRGVARLSAILDGTSTTLGDVEPSDGLVVTTMRVDCGGDHRGPFVHASVGARALHARDLNMTLHSRLPAEVLAYARRRGVAATIRLEPGRLATIADDPLLKDLLDGAAVHDLGLPVALGVERRGSSLVASVKRKSNRQPAHWFKHWSRTRSVVRVAAWPRLASPRRFVGSCAALLVGGSRSLGFVAPVRDVTLPEVLEPWTLTAVATERGPVAVLSVDRRIEPGDYSLSRLQDVPTADLSALQENWDWDRLRLLPILVPEPGVDLSGTPEPSVLVPRGTK